MSGRNDLVPRCPDLCRELADHYEAQARYLRTHARGLEAAELHEWRRTFKVWRSGKLARALTENGMPEPLAIKITARRIKIEPETVAAQLRFQMKCAQRAAIQRQKKEARRLAKAGHSLRQIGTALGLSKSRIGQLIND